MKFFFFCHGADGLVDMYVVHWKACMMHGIRKIKAFTGQLVEP